MPDAGRQMCEKWSSKEKGCVKLTPLKKYKQKQSKNAEKGTQKKNEEGK